jgi:shikimate dehydrogenase
LVLRGRRILVVGAGGATRGVVGPLLARSPARITIANRTVEKAHALRDVFTAHGKVDACALDAIADVGADVVINATSASTRGEALTWPAALFGPGVFAYDMAYGAALGDFVMQARAQGSQARDGLGMLVEQAAESFRLWRGVHPATDAILASLRARFP